MKYLANALLGLVVLCMATSAAAQTPKDSTLADAIRETLSQMPLLGKNKYTFNYKSFSQFWPSQENPSVGWRSSTRSKEPIIFDFHPTLTLNLYNDFPKKLSRDKLLSMDYYIAFRPHFRLYQKESNPVTMPSYRVFIGLRHMYRLDNKNYFGYGFESGHYSNGQDGCPFGLSTSDCDSVYASITNETDLAYILNRKNGDFSTNLTEYSVNYNYVPKRDAYNRPQQVHTVSASLLRYHNRLFGMFLVGGYTPDAIKTYGRTRLQLMYAFRYHWPSGYRFAVSETMELIHGAHPSVNPFRSVTSFTIFLPRNTGFYINYTYGHDDYNLRFTDDGHQFGIGLVWDMFPPNEIGEEE